MSSNGSSTWGITKGGEGLPAASTKSRRFILRSFRARFAGLLDDELEVVDS